MTIFIIFKTQNCVSEAKNNKQKNLSRNFCSKFSWLINLSILNRKNLNSPEVTCKKINKINTILFTFHKNVFELSFKLYIVFFFFYKLTKPEFVLNQFVKESKCVKYART